MGDVYPAQRRPRGASEWWKETWKTAEKATGVKITVVEEAAPSPGRSARPSSPPG